MPAPFEIIAAPYIVYYAVIGESFPIIEAAVAGNWIKIGTSGDRNYTEDGVTISHGQTIEEFRSLGSTGPIKAFRTEESFKVAFNVADLTLEEYKLVLNSGTVTDTAAGSGAAGHRAIDIWQGMDVTRLAILIRGVFSPYGAAWNSQLEIPVAYQSASPDVVFQKGTPAALSMEFTALEDPSAAAAANRFGAIRVQDEAIV